MASATPGMNAMRLDSRSATADAMRVDSRSASRARNGSGAKFHVGVGMPMRQHTRRRRNSERRERHGPKERQRAQLGRDALIAARRVAQRERATHARAETAKRVRHYLAERRTEHGPVADANAATHAEYVFSGVPVTAADVNRLDGAQRPLGFFVMQGSYPDMRWRWVKPSDGDYEMHVAEQRAQEQRAAGPQFRRRL
jgi:hypothetical protein